MATQINTLTNIMPVILARALMTLRQRCFMPRLVNSDYSVDAAKKGTTIDVPVPVAVGKRFLHKQIQMHQQLLLQLKYRFH